MSLRQSPLVGSDVSRADALLAEFGADGMQEVMRHALTRHAWRVLALLHPTDTTADADAVISRGEFVKALPLLGIVCERAAVGRLF